MSERASTKGPWEVRSSEMGDGLCIYTPDGYGIGKAWDLNGKPENAANAYLIAAAPDILAALRSFVGAGDWEDASRPGHAMTGSRVSYGQLRQAAAAIAKAEGLGQRADANSTNPLSEGRERS